MKLRSTFGQVYHQGGGYTWRPGEVLDVPDDVAAAALRSHPDRFEIIEDPQLVEQATGSNLRQVVLGRDRQQRGGRNRTA